MSWMRNSQLVMSRIKIYRMVIVMVMVMVVMLEFIDINDSMKPREETMNIWITWKKRLLVGFHGNGWWRWQGKHQSFSTGLTTMQFLWVSEWPLAKLKEHLNVIEVEKLASHEQLLLSSSWDFWGTKLYLIGHLTTFSRVKWKILIISFNT